MIAALKFAHLLGVSCWLASLVALPLLLYRHSGTRGQADYARFRLMTHLTYIALMTPAAVISVVAGTGLIFAASVFQPWLLLKLAFVAVMVLVHVWFGHLVQVAGEQRSPRRLSGALVGLGIVLPAMGIVLGLVLAKPDLSWIRDLIPDQFLLPRAESP